jgi:hypothetical protein
MARGTKRRGSRQKRLRNIANAGPEELVPGNAFRMTGVDMSLDVMHGHYAGASEIHLDGFEEGTVHVLSPRLLRSSSHEVMVRNLEEVSYDEDTRGVTVHVSPVGQEIPLEGLTGEALAEFQSPFRAFIRDIDEWLRDYLTSTLALPEESLRRIAAYTRGIAGLASMDYEQLLIAANALAYSYGIENDRVRGTPFQKCQIVERLVEGRQIQEFIARWRRSSPSNPSEHRKAAAALKELAEARRIYTGKKFNDMREEAQYYCTMLEQSLRRKPKKKEDPSLVGIAKDLVARLEGLGDRRKLDLRTKADSETPSVVQLYEERYHLLEDMIYHAYDSGNEHRITRVNAKMKELIEEVSEVRASGRRRVRKVIGGLKLTREETDRFEAILESYKTVEAEAKEAAKLLKRYDWIVGQFKGGNFLEKAESQKEGAIALLDSTHQMASFEEMLAVYRQLRPYFKLLTDTIALSKKHSDEGNRLRGQIGWESLFALRDNELVPSTSAINFLRHPYKDLNVARAELATETELSYVLRCTSDSAVYQNIEPVEEGVLRTVKVLLERERVFCLKNKSGDILGYATITGGLDYYPIVRGKMGSARADKSPYIHFIVVPFGVDPKKETKDALGILEELLKGPGVEKIFALVSKGYVDIFKERGYSLVGVQTHHSKRGDKIYAKRVSQV